MYTVENSLRFALRDAMRCDDPSFMGLVSLVLPESDSESDSEFHFDAILAVEVGRGQANGRTDGRTMTTTTADGGPVLVYTYLRTSIHT